MIIDWWHVAAISLAMAHATWYRYHFSFVPDYHQREELAIEAGLFLEPEDYAGKTIEPLMAPVVTALINKNERHLITDPIIDRALLIARHEDLCVAIFELSESINTWVYGPLREKFYASLDLVPEGTADLSTE
jgi:hypothetical protein